MQDRPTERVRVLLDGLTASAIVDRVHPYYSGYQFEGEWLDTLKESIEGELDDIDRIIRGRAGTVGAVDNLREYVLTAPSVCSTTRAILVGYIDGIEREVADMVRLPVDADGVTIHAGDMLDGYGKTIEVVELRHGRSGWVLISRDGNGYADCAAFSHHHAPTVEDVLREFYVYAERGKEHHREDVDDAVLAEYAARLRLAGEDA